MTPRDKKPKNEQIILSLYTNSIGFGYAVMTNALTVLNSQVVQYARFEYSALKRIKTY